MTADERTARLHKMKRYIITLIALITIGVAAPQVQAHTPPPPDHVAAAIHYAAAEWNVNLHDMQDVAHCESTYNVNARNGSYYGLFQHANFKGRAHAFNEHVKLHNSRHPNQQLPGMSGTWNAAIDNARLTAAYVAGVLPGYKGGWSWWSQCR